VDRALEPKHARRLLDWAQLAGWPTPNTPSGGRSVDISQMSSTGMTTDGRKHTVSLEHVVKFAGWPTPDASVHGAKDLDRLQARRAALKQKHSNGNGFGLSLTQAAPLLAGWPTPQQADVNMSRASLEYQLRKQVQSPYPNLATTAQLAGWATPRANEGERGGRGDNLGLLRGYPMKHNATLGLMPSGSPASTARRGALNPLFSLWLMLGSGELARAWASCAPPATRSSRR
jgi:hypothetical protein